MNIVSVGDSMAGPGGNPLWNGTTVTGELVRIAPNFNVLAQTHHPGYTISQMVARIGAAVPTDGSADALMFFGGTNDCLQGRPRLESFSSMDRVSELLAERGVQKLYWVLPLAMGDANFEAIFRAKTFIARALSWAQDKPEVVLLMPWKAVMDEHSPTVKPEYRGFSFIWGQTDTVHFSHTGKTEIAKDMALAINGGFQQKFWQIEKVARPSFGLSYDSLGVDIPGVDVEGRGFNLDVNEAKVITQEFGVVAGQAIVVEVSALAYQPLLYRVNTGFSESGWSDWAVLMGGRLQFSVLDNDAIVQFCLQPNDGVISFDNVVVRYE